MRVVYPDHDPNETKFQEALPKWMWMITEIHFD